MKKFKPIIRCVIFLAGLATIMGVIDFACVQTGYVNYILRNVCAKDNGTDYDTVVIGASHARASSDPEQIDKNAGTYSINMAIPGETVKDSYYVLEETCRTNDIKTVILDIDYQYYFNPPKEGFYTEQFIQCQMDWRSYVKWQYIYDNMERMEIRNVFTRRQACTFTPSNMKENIEQKLSKEYKEADISSLNVDGGTYAGRGYFYINPVSGELAGQKLIESWSKRSKEQVTGYPLKYLNKIIKYCRDNDIDLIAVTSPITPSSVGTLHMENVHDTINKLLADNGVFYYDFNMARQDILPREDSDFVDKEGHMNGEFAKEYSEFLGKIIKEHKQGTKDINKYFYSSFQQMYNTEAELYGVVEK